MASKDHDPQKGGKARGIAVAALGALVLLGGVALLLLPRQPGQTPPPAPPPGVPAAPPAPAASGIAPPQFDVVRVDSQGNTVIAGRAAPGAKVIVKDNGAVLGTAVADSHGAFVLLPTAPLPPGTHEITLAEIPPAGAEMAGNQNAVVSVLGNGGQVLAVLSGPNGSTVLTGQGPQAGTLGIGAVDYDTGGHAIFSGTAPAGASVALRLGEQEIGEAKADARGRWHIAAAVPDHAGILTLAGTVNGVALPAVTAPFAPETLATALGEGHVIITPGDCLWLIARRVYGHGVMYTLIYSANAGKIRDPNLIFPGQNFALPKPKG